DAKVLDELRAIRAKGILIGVTGSGPSQSEIIRRALEIRCDGQPLFGAVQATWNLLERAAESALREGHAAGLSVLIKEPLANARLTSRAEDGRSGPLRAAADRHQVSADAIALAFVAQQSWADVLLLGAAVEGQLDSNLRALDVRLKPDDLEALDAMREPSEQYWSRRAALAWT